MTDENKPHRTGVVKCRLCEHEHVAVWPVDIVDEDAQECPNCKHMSCEPVEDYLDDG